MFMNSYLNEALRGGIAVMAAPEFQHHYGDLLSYVLFPVARMRRPQQYRWLMDAETPPTQENHREAVIEAMIALAKAMNLAEADVASRLAHQCIDLYQADINAYKLLGEEAVRGYRAGDLSGAS